MLALSIHFLSLTKAIISTFYIKKTLPLIFSLNQLINYSQNLKNL